MAAFPKKEKVSLWTRKSPRHALRNSRSFKRYLSQLKRNAEFPATSQEEPRFPASTLDEALFLCTDPVESRDAPTTPPYS